MLGQEAEAEKSNEVTAIPLLLARLDLTGQIVTIDAMGCQRAIAAQIVGQGGDYVLALKDNQDDLREDVVDSFTVAAAFGTPLDDRVSTIEKDHGRREHRVCATIAWLDPAGAWPGLRSIAQVTATRRIGEQEPTNTVRYYLSSLPGDARQIARAVRSHWGIENSLHWVLDIAFREDDIRARTGHSAENLALIRKLALNLLRLQPIPHPRHQGESAAGGMGYRLSPPRAGSRLDAIALESHPAVTFAYRPCGTIGGTSGRPMSGGANDHRTEDCCAKPTGIPAEGDSQAAGTASRYARWQDGLPRRRPV